MPIATTARITAQLTSGSFERPTRTRPITGYRRTVDRRRVTPVPGGPLLVDGPVEVELPDGTLVVAERPVVALCTCRRSRRQPFCDTSHRTKVRPDS